MGKWDVYPAAAGVEFERGPVGDGMVLTGWWPDVGGPDRDGLFRMTYTLKEGEARAPAR